jgi:hypothetical protein
MKNPTRSHCCILEERKRFVLYPRVQKNEECADLSVVDSAYFKTIKFIRFYHFFAVKNTKNVALKFCTLVEYIVSISKIICNFKNDFKI